jgi:hypothetical protein
MQNSCKHLCYVYKLVKILSINNSGFQKNAFIIEYDY